MSTNDGGPAFPSMKIFTNPTVDRESGIKYGDVYSETTPGNVSVRDYFAAKAMEALIASPRRSVDINGKYADSNQNVLAGMAYFYADAMLRAREVKQ